MAVSFVTRAYLEGMPSGERARHMPLGYHPNTGDVLLVSDTDRYAGMRILGKAGYGKSGLLEWMIHQDAVHGNAVIVIDPHSDLVTKCIAGLPVTDAARTYLLDMEDEDYPFGVNVFAHRPFKTGIEHEQAINRITHIFEVLWPQVMEQQNLPLYVQTAIIALLANPGMTLVDMRRFLTDRTFRTQLLANVTDPTVHDHWREHDALSESQQQTKIMPILTRLGGLFTGKSLVRNIVGQRVTSINFRQAIQERQIVFIKLPLKTLGTSAELVGKLIVSQIHAALFSFADMPESQRPGFSLYIDEFANFSTQDIEELFTEGRKFGVRLTIAHQFTKQVPERMRDATETARSQVCFQLAPEDAPKMARFFPTAGMELTADDIDTHPVKYLLERGTDDPSVREFIEEYLYPLDWHRRQGRIEIQNPHVDASLYVYGLMAGHATNEPIQVADPVPLLDRLLYEVMRTGNPNLTIDRNIAIGFSNCGVGFHGAVWRASDQDFTADAHFPRHLAINTETSVGWARPVETSKEQLWHFLFFLRLTMQHLALNPIGEPSKSSVTAIAQMLTELPVRGAFVRSGADVGAIFTFDTPEHTSGADLAGRMKFIREQTRQRYCHPRAQVEAAFKPAEATVAGHDAAPRVDTELPRYEEVM
jgi:hypothetical protein